MPKSPGRKPLVLTTTEGPQKLSQRATVYFFPREAEQLTQGGRVPLAPAVRALLDDLFTLYGLPRPIRAALEEDMRALGMSAESPREYLVWLLHQRYVDLTREARDERRCGVA